MVIVLKLILILGLVAIVAVVFGVWMIARLAIWIVDAVFGVSRKPPLVRPRAISTASPCARPNCRAVNPAHARFCHRCGNAIAIGRGAASPAPMRYVA
jgi:hypothetical protein